MIRIGKTKISLPMILFMYMLIYNPPLLAPLYRSNSVWLVMLPSITYVLMHRKELKEFTNLRAVVWTEAVGSVIALLLGQHTVQLMLSYTVCLTIGVYWIVYLVLSRKY